LCAVLSRQWRRSCETATVRLAARFVQSLQHLRLSILNPGLVARLSIDQDFQRAADTQR
jgi:hypothetical protein